MPTAKEKKEAEAKEAEAKAAAEKAEADKKAAAEAAGGENPTESDADVAEPQPGATFGRFEDFDNVSSEDGVLPNHHATAEESKGRTDGDVLNPTSRPEGLQADGVLEANGRRSK